MNGTDDAITPGRCTQKTEVYSRIVGYFRPIEQWNEGKQAEFTVRVPFDLEKSESKERGLENESH